VGKAYSIGTFSTDLDASDLAALRQMLEMQGWGALRKLLQGRVDHASRLGMSLGCEVDEWHSLQGEVGLGSDLINDLKTWVKDAKEVDVPDPAVTE